MFHLLRRAKVARPQQGPRARNNAPKGSSSPPRAHPSRFARPSNRAIPRLILTAEIAGLVLVAPVAQVAMEDARTHQLLRLRKPPPRRLSEPGVLWLKGIHLSTPAPHRLPPLQSKLLHRQSRPRCPSPNLLLLRNPTDPPPCRLQHSSSHLLHSNSNSSKRHLAPFFRRARGLPCLRERRQFPPRAQQPPMAGLCPLTLRVQALLLRPVGRCRLISLKICAPLRQRLPSTWSGARLRTLLRRCRDQVVSRNLSPHAQMGLPGRPGVPKLLQPPHARLWLMQPELRLPHRHHPLLLQRRLLHPRKTFTQPSSEPARGEKRRKRRGWPRRNVPSKRHSPSKRGSKRPSSSERERLLRRRPLLRSELSRKRRQQQPPLLPLRPLPPPRTRLPGSKLLPTSPHLGGTRAQSMRRLTRRGHVGSQLRPLPRTRSRLRLKMLP